MSALDKLDISKIRLCNQHISQTSFSSPSEVVSWFGAMQAQDYHGSKWSVGLRMKSATDSTIEKSIANKEIIRTWALRGTLHFVTPPDIYWIMDLVAPKLIKSLASRYKQMELDSKLISKSNNLLVKAVEGNKALTRAELKEILSKSKIPTHELRLGFILQRAVFDKLMCLGPRRDKEFTFVSLEEWAPKTKAITREEAISLLAKRFYQSHFPATDQDFAWWSGLTINEARSGSEMNKSTLIRESINGIDYWVSENIHEVKSNIPDVFLLPGFDEYMLGYKDRSAIIDNQHVKHVFASGNAIFKNTIVINGKVEGTWSRAIKKNEVIIETYLFPGLKKTYSKELKKEAERFGKFLGMETRVVRIE